MLDKKYLLSTKTALKLYEISGGLPIIDYHCHLSPQEIFEDKPFDNIGEMWLGGDHYKWRLMRTAGIDEKYITGDSDFHEKFLHYAGAIEFAAGNPLYHWSHMELSQFFNIDTPITSSTAEDIWCAANKYIKDNVLSPRKLIKQSAVEIICTTDDIVDSLEWHKKIREDNSFDTVVIPSYRTDNLMLMRRDGYADYIKKLSAVSGIEVDGLDSLKAAAENRLNFFIENGCKCTDVGIPFFPNGVASDSDADRTFKALLKGKEVSDDDYLALLGNLYVFFGEIYKKNGLCMQWHLSVTRNSNSRMFEALGGDCGVDCVGDAVSGPELINMLDAINRKCGLPETVIYTLNPANAEQIASIAGAFPHVRCGAAWWFCDHKRGIENEIKVISENGSLGAFLGMLTDSRSFLSYARHDYFRRILCDIVGKWVEDGEYYGDAAELVKKISYYNIKALIGG